MKIKNLYIDGFRCLQKFSINFEDDFTIIVGENDSGKTSLIDCLKIITQNKMVENDDFLFGGNQIDLRIEIDNLIFTKSYLLAEGVINQLPLKCRPTIEYLDFVRAKISGDNYIPELEENSIFLRETGKLFGITVRSNSNINNVRMNIINQIDEMKQNDELLIENAVFPKFSNIQLDGKHFENVSSFFQEVFIREKQKSIWQEEVESGLTIDEFIKDKIDEYSKKISDEMNQTSIIDNIRLFLPDLTNIIVEPIYQPRDLMIEAKVKFLENDQEINFQKKGDGTKRRITMALLNFKKERDKSDETTETIYLLDEPDTHLHVKAQLELLNTLQDFASSGNQIIITTHSPFIINSVKPNQIRLLHTAENNHSVIKQISEQSTLPEFILSSLGIENVYLFFARIIIIVEGETEYEFISNYYYRKYNRTIDSKLIKIINVKGIQNIYGFSRGILELHDPKKILVIHDNELSSEMEELIDKLGIEGNNRFINGQKEFEDSFSDDVLYDCWKNYHIEESKELPPMWSIQEIGKMRQVCSSDNSKKFSKSLRSLNAKGKKMTKPIFGAVLAKYIESEKMPQKITEFFTELEKI